jgi:hypothetical protein
MSTESRLQEGWADVSSVPDGYSVSTEWVIDPSGNRRELIAYVYRNRDRAAWGDKVPVAFTTRRRRVSLLKWTSDVVIDHDETMTNAERAVQRGLEVLRNA